jgi:hypothetical protein
LRFVGDDTRKVDHTPVFRIPSASEPGHIHNVVWVARDEHGDGGGLLCSYEGAWHGCYYTHRATARQYLISQHKQLA